MRLSISGACPDNSTLEMAQPTSELLRSVIELFRNVPALSTRPSQEEGQEAGYDAVYLEWSRHAIKTLMSIPTTKGQGRQAFLNSFGLGVAADRFGFAFLGGYHCAVRYLWSRLDPSISLDGIGKDCPDGESLALELSVLAASEKGPAVPKNIHTTARVVSTRATDMDIALHGTKSFVTGGKLARHILVVAKAVPTAVSRNDQAQLGEYTSRSSLVCVHVDESSSSTNDSGVSIGQNDVRLGFVPEIAHNKIVMENARVGLSNLLGTRVPAVQESCSSWKDWKVVDGFEGILKPFRVIEDALVSASLCGYLIKTLDLAASHLQQQDDQQRDLCRRVCGGRSGTTNPELPGYNKSGTGSASSQSSLEEGQLKELNNALHAMTDQLLALASCLFDMMHEFDLAWQPQRNQVFPLLSLMSAPSTSNPTESTGAGNSNRVLPFMQTIPPQLLLQLDDALQRFSAMHTSLLALAPRISPCLCEVQRIRWDWMLNRDWKVSQIAGPARRLRAQRAKEQLNALQLPGHSML